MRARKPPAKRRTPRSPLEPPPPDAGSVPEVIDREVVGPGRVASRWPLLVALVPDPDTWRVSGAGRTLVARRRADGRIAWGALSFDLKRPDSLLVFGDRATDEGAFEEILDALYRIDDAPPLVGGTDRLAARFTFGAFAHARAHEPALADVDQTLLAVFEQPSESPEELRLAFDRELCPRELAACCELEIEAALPAGQGLAVHVAMGFKVAEPLVVARGLAEDRDFASSGKNAFDWKPSRAGGQRVGSVTLLEGELEAETVSLDFAGRLCARLKRVAQGGLGLVRVSQQPLT